MRETHGVDYSRGSLDGGTSTAATSERSRRARGQITFDPPNEEVTPHLSNLTWMTPRVSKAPVCASERCETRRRHHAVGNFLARCHAAQRHILTAQCAPHEASASLRSTASSRCICHCAVSPTAMRIAAMA